MEKVLGHFLKEPKSTCGQKTEHAQQPKERENSDVRRVLISRTWSSNHATVVGHSRIESDLASGAADGPAHQHFRLHLLATIWADDDVHVDDDGFGRLSLHPLIGTAFCPRTGFTERAVTWRFRRKP